MGSQHGSTAVVCRRSMTRLALYGSGLPKQLVEALWNEPEALLAAGDVLRSKGARTTVRLSWQGQKYVLKHYVEPTWRHALKQLLLPSRARATWRAMHALVEAGIATPRPVACIENLWGELRRDSYLMYPYLEGRTLGSYFAGEWTGPRPAVEGLWRQLGELWQRLAQLRVSLPDTNLRNFIVSPAGQLWVIDLDKARFHRLAYVAARHQQRGWKQLARAFARSQTSRHAARAAA